MPTTNGGLTHTRIGVPPQPYTSLADVSARKRTYADQTLAGASAFVYSCSIRGRQGNTPAPSAVQTPHACRPRMGATNKRIGVPPQPCSSLADVSARKRTYAAQPWWARAHSFIRVLFVVGRAIPQRISGSNLTHLPTTNGGHEYTNRGSPAPVHIAGRRISTETYLRGPNLGGRERIRLFVFYSWSAGQYPSALSGSNPTRLPSTNGGNE